MDGDGGFGGEGDSDHAGGGGHGSSGVAPGCHNQGGMTDTHSSMGQTHTEMSQTQGFGLHGHGGHCAMSGQLRVHGAGAGSCGQQGTKPCGWQLPSGVQEIPDGMELRLETRQDIDLMPCIRTMADRLDLSCVDFRASELHGAVLVYRELKEVPGTFGAPPMVPDGGCAGEGATEVWRQYWQIGYRREPEGFMESFGLAEIPLLPRRQIRGFLEVTRVRWTKSGGAFEERLRVVVKHFQVKILSTGQRVCDHDDLSRHCRAAIQLFEECGKYLKCHGGA